jgi:hypothetical protein
MVAEAQRRVVSDARFQMLIAIGGTSSNGTYGTGAIARPVARSSGVGMPLEQLVDVVVGQPEVRSGPLRHTRAGLSTTEALVSLALAQ